MCASVSDLFEPLISRDAGALPAAVAEFRKEHSSEELLEAAVRFTALAFAPSQPSRHALYAVLAARALWRSPDSDGLSMPAGWRDQIDDITTACLHYAAMSRLPWSEPPLPDPPSFDPSAAHSIDDARAAIANRDRLAGEVWLAANLPRPTFLHDLLTLAAEDLSDFGFRLVTAVEVMDLAAEMPPERRFAVLRLAVWEWTSMKSEMTAVAPESPSAGQMATALAARVVREQGSIEALHDLALLEVACRASDLAGDRRIEERVCRFLAPAARPAAPAPAPALQPFPRPPLAYAYGRDYSGYLRSFILQQRLEARFPAQRFSSVVDAAATNLLEGPFL